MKLLLTILLISVSVGSYCQTQPPTLVKAITAGEYLEKSRQQKTWAWVLLGAGAVVSGVGVVIGFPQAVDLYFFGNGSSSGAILTLGGLGMIAGSVPLFIAAARNKGKAMSLNVISKLFIFHQGQNFIKAPTRWFL